MAFAPVPAESKSKINKAGAILITDDAKPGDLEWAQDLAERWRACHAYPISTFQATLRTKLRSYSGEPIAAQRLKRMPTIIDKLRRYLAMKLTTMQDIGGVRAILASVKEVNNLVHEYRGSKRLAHQLIGHKDYVQEPRSEDGYRSIHLIYSYKNNQVARTTVSELNFRSAPDFSISGRPQSSPWVLFSGKHSSLAEVTRTGSTFSLLYPPHSA